MATILVVDDRADDRQLLTTLIGYYGHRVLEATDGAEALQIAQAERPELIITDILMPTMDGYEFVRRLRADPNIAMTAVVFYTANYLEREALAMAQACGVSQILSKPCEPAEVMRTVEAVLHLAIPTAPTHLRHGIHHDDTQDPSEQSARRITAVEIDKLRLPAEAMHARLRQAQGLVSELIAQVRDMSLDLRPAILDDFGLLPALLWQIERYMSQTRVHVTLEHDGLHRRFAPEVETAAYRIVQEALTNVARHAEVDEAVVRLGIQAETLIVQVADQGTSFNPQAALTARRTSGLAGMRERAGLVGGRWLVESAPGAGTLVRAEVPLYPAAERLAAIPTGDRHILKEREA